VAFDPVNLARTDAGEVYYHYNGGVHPALGEVLGQLDEERVQLAAAFGVRSETFPEKLQRQFKLPRQDESFYMTMQRTKYSPDVPGSRNLYMSTSYRSIEALMNSRYPTEDVPGLFTMNWFARRAGLDLPGHAEYESFIRARLSELGMSDETMHNQLEAYLPHLARIDGGVPEITDLLNAPHVRPQA
jgi:opine dehydrogenase